jgi:uncharacterized membrane protein YfcA
MLLLEGGGATIIGATIGGLAVAYAPVTFLKVLLGCVLLAAAAKTATFRQPLAPLALFDLDLYAGGIGNACAKVKPSCL